MVKLLTALLGSLFLAGIALAGVSAVDPPAASAAPSGGYVGKCGGGKIFLKAGERQSFYYHNQQRKSRNMRQLCVQPNLQKAARAHSANMLRSGNFSHGNVGQRLRRHGYNWSRYGENIAYNSGSPKPASIFRSWMNSSGHRSNILDRGFREVGIGTAEGRGRTMWTVDFGNRR